MSSIKHGYVYTFFSKIYHFIKINICLAKLKRNRRKIFLGDKESNLIVSLTSYPARIDHVWITIESLFAQSYQPWKIVLVLSKAEFPDQKLPNSLVDQIGRGLEILWTESNTRSYKKLLPVREKYPDALILTVDDDIAYDRSRVRTIIRAHKDNPNSVVGCRGREIKFDGHLFGSYMEWPLATLESPSYRTMLTGVGGILYPPGLIDDKLLLDIDAAQRLAPTADDIWFWMATVCSGVPVKCLGINRSLSIKFRDKRKSLTTINCGEGRNDIQMNAVDRVYQASKLIGM
ncbi:hypothetical protein SAMN04488490_0021 [Marinobacter sp. LV10R510-11A]|uniref:hypothetical protein n=1 Tax=Marinobacter sp. LV10R510-11A TaxID=1415568 RepID=UPI000BB7978F|nr:hypothetical protein [Marinobacter sp. LV10R510-11A]SOB74542.1 hypothetical protein SAMN04488490_0021 [Marinobacter sp. LV10R510-11A]